MAETNFNALVDNLMTVLLNLTHLILDRDHLKEFNYGNYFNLWSNMVLYLVFFKLNNAGVTAYVSLIMSIITGLMTIMILVNHVDMKYETS